METCKYCGRELKNKHALKAHEFRCKSNPDYEENKKSYTEVMKKLQDGARQKPSAYFDYTSNCQKCGKEFTQRTTQSKINRNKHQKCCCRACANSRVKTDEVKKKTREALNNFYKSIGKSRNSDNPEHSINCSKSHHETCKHNRCKEVLNHECMYCGKKIRAKYKKDVYCYECAKLRGLKNILLYDDDGKQISSDNRREASRKVQQKLLKEGRHKGWQSRNIISYPEKFWMEVLKNNNIDYSFNHVIKKSELGVENDNSNYFLDFLIDGNIDLEIDGKQHKYADRAESDKVRDELLSKNGYTVYRVEWNEINTEVGKQHMKEKIETFLKFIGLQKSLAQNFC